MDLREQILVNGHPVRIQPYTERRAKELDKINKEVDGWIKENKSLKFSQVPKKMKADIWMRKARIMWQPYPDRETIAADQWDEKEQFFTKKFFEDQDFEYPLLQKTEVFFMSQELYL